MQRILVPVDGSAPSLRALDFLGRQHADGLEAEVRLVHVLELSSYSAPYVPASTMDALLEAGLKAQGTVLETASARTASLGLDATAVGLRGCASEEILRQAAEWKADQIVMGTRGMGSMKSLLLGSLAQSVLHLADAPVTLVK